MRGGLVPVQCYFTFVQAFQFYTLFSCLNVTSAIVGLGTEGLVAGLWVHVAQWVFLCLGV